MYPQLFHFKTPGFFPDFFPDYVSLYSYGFFIALGVLVSFWFVLKRAKALGVSSDQLANLYMFCIVAGFVGGKLFYYLEDWAKYMAHPKLMLEVTGGGFVFYGSLIFVTPTIVLWLKARSIAVRPFMDVVAFIGPIIQGIGRVGCLMAGCCHGRVCDSILGISFSHPLSKAQPLNVPLYPTQIFDALINAAIIIFLLWLEKRQRFSGQLVLTYLALYAIGRSINEEFRGDEARGFVFDGCLSHSQLIAAIIFIFCCFFWWKWSKQERQIASI